MKKGLGCIKLVIMGMKDIRINVVQVSCDQSGGEGGYAKCSLSLTGGGGGCLERG